MNQLTKYLAVSSVIVGLGMGAAWAAEPLQQKAYDHKPAAASAAPEITASVAAQQKAHDQKPAEAELRAEIASPITGEFAPGAHMSQDMRLDVGGYNGSGFLSPAGQPSNAPAGTPGNPGPSY